MKDTITLEDGTVYKQDADKQGWTVIGKLRAVQIGMDPKVHKLVKRGCKFHCYHYDIDKNMCEGCTHPKNRPAGCSWGECDPMDCPLTEEETTP